MIRCLLCRGNRVSIRAPARGATEHTFGCYGMSVFQFALPRGERRFLRPGGILRRGFNSRSREGSDAPQLVRLDDFLVSIRAPARGATCGFPCRLNRFAVSIRAPARGATFARERGEDGQDVSIRAPARGAT